MNLKDYQTTIHTLAIRKGWNMDLPWMQLGCYKEVGELVQAIEHDMPVEVIGKEFGDIMFFLLQTMHHFNIDVDKALLSVIERNKVEKKKTLSKTGKIVRK